MLDLQKPDDTTVIRWLLRALVVIFLTWLVRRSPQREDKDRDNDSGDSVNVRRPGQFKTRASAGSGKHSLARLVARRDPYPAAVRERRQLHRAAKGDDDIGDVGTLAEAEEQLPKPATEMWEVRKNGEPPRILRRQPSEDRMGDEAEVVVAPAEAKSMASASEARGKELTLCGHDRPVTFVTWNRDCNLLFTCGKDKLVCVWSFPEGERLGTYTGHSGAVWACSVTHDSRWLVTCGADRLVIVWDARTSRELKRVELPGVVRFVEWAGCADRSHTGGPVGERFVSCHNRFGAHPPAITVWRFDGGKAIEEVLRIIRLPTAATQVRWGRGDYFVVSGHESGYLLFWRADTGAEVKRIKAHESPVARFDFSSDRELVASVSRDMFVKLWDVGKGSEWKLLSSAETERPLNAVAVGPLTRAAAVSVPSKRPTRCCIAAAGGNHVREVSKSAGPLEQFGALLFRLGTGEASPGTLRLGGTSKGHFGPVHALAMARDGFAMASGSEDGFVRIQPIETVSD